MRHLRPCLSLLVAAAAAAGCVPAGMAPDVPAVAGSRPLVLDARQGTARALGRMDLGGRGGRSLLAQVDTYDQASIDHVTIELFTVVGENDDGPRQDLVDVGSDQLDGTLTFVGLHTDTTYRVKATAYATAGSGQPISVPEDSQADFYVGTNDRPTATLIPVRLKDVAFQGRATSDGLDIQDGGHVTAGAAFITPGMNLDDEQVMTIAGDAYTQLSGATDDPNPLNARFNGPMGVAVIGLDTYISEVGNDTIRKIAADGTVTTVAGAYGRAPSANTYVGPAASAGLIQPNALAADPAGNLYIADADYTSGAQPGAETCLIRKIATDGTLSTVAGGANGSANGNGLSARFQGIQGIAHDRDHTLYISDMINRKIRKLDLTTGDVTNLAGSTLGSADGPAASAQFFIAAGLAVDLDGNLLVCDQGNDTIRKVTFKGGGEVEVSTIAGSTAQPGDGTFSDDGVGTAARFDDPTQIAVDGLGNAWVTERYRHRIRKLTFDASGVPTVTTFVGVGDEAGAYDSNTQYGPHRARFTNPAGMAFEQAGRMIVADRTNHMIRRIGFFTDGGSY